MIAIRENNTYLKNSLRKICRLFSTYRREEIPASIDDWIDLPLSGFYILDIISTFPRESHGTAQRIAFKELRSPIKPFLTIVNIAAYLDIRAGWSFLTFIREIDFPRPSLCSADGRYDIERSNF